MREGDHHSIATIRRILVAVDGSPSSLAAIEAAARLAIEMKAELEGLFVEDVNLLHFAGLPFTRVVDSLSARARPIAPAGLETAMRAQAARARKALASAAGSRVTWSFRVVRGNVEGEVLEAARKVDLVSLGFTGDWAAGGVRAGSLARRAVLELPGSVLLLRRAQRAGAPVAVCYEESAGGERALFCAASMARAQGGGLMVVTQAETVDEAHDIEAKIAAHLRGWHLKLSFHHVGDGGKRSLREALAVAHGGIMVVSADSALVRGEALGNLVDSCSCSLFLAR